MRVGGLAVVPDHVAPEVEGDRRAVRGEVPALGQIGPRLVVLIVVDERHEIHELLLLAARGVARYQSVHAVADLPVGADDQRAPVAGIARGGVRGAGLLHEAGDPAECLLAEGALRASPTLAATRGNNSYGCDGE